MGNSIYWIIALVVLQALIGALAKKAQKNQQAQSKPGGPAAPQRTSRNPQAAPGRVPQPLDTDDVNLESAPSDSPDQVLARPVEPVRAPTPPQQKVVPVARKSAPATPPKKIPASPRTPTGGAPTSSRKIVRGGAPASGKGSTRGAIATRDRLGDPKRRFGLGDGTRGTIRPAGKPPVAPGAAPSAAPASPKTLPAVAHLQRANAGLSAGRPGLSADGQRIAGGAGAAGVAAPRPADLRALFRDPKRFRDAFVVGELLAQPRSLRGF